jgi:hypothetical protein
MNRRSLLAGATLLAASPWIGAAVEPVSEHTLKDFTIGEIVLGDQVKLDSLAGKVVALEFWGVH